MPHDKNLGHALLGVPKLFNLLDRWHHCPVLSLFPFLLRLTLSEVAS